MCLNSSKNGPIEAEDDGGGDEANAVSGSSSSQLNETPHGLVILYFFQARNSTVSLCRLVSSISNSFKTVIHVFHFT